ncbi:rRNA-processing protein NOP12 Ecym_2633 [Eremothecium cymbalariae DBVPG|uniref:Nucleolar protein 12 n=1 Tax=Eremothecium cymbalariae (strain CBS 270.75 / DBVPG 7215 / KCTC 17166 / NRRL Y-17582) TaxID=931890 RepID=G8JNS0_ERECY|nr:Hypothetical protein Ecym_2633 [Eremothecium cymbalariae DBVPG\
MSALVNLFGSLKTDKLQKNVADLLQTSSGPVDTLQVKAKKRTVLEEDHNEEEEHNEDVLDGKVEAVARKRVKRMSGEEEQDNLEGEYFAKILGEEEKEEKEEKDAGAGVKMGEGANASRIDLKEFELEKADRTVFVGNVTHDAIVSKKVYKEFKKLLSLATDRNSLDEGDEDEYAGGSKQSTENPKVESIRFRSIAFEEPLPRKVAFVQQKLHKSRDSVNAYVVYKERSSIPVVCKALNGVVFHGHHLRFDSVAHPAPHDKKRSVFVGNLDFEEIEENLWKHFESCGDIEYVRIIRDPKSNVGKGFAYVQFMDAGSVNKALLLHEKKMTIGKCRKLRVSRCKNMKKVQPLPGKLNKLTDQQKTKIGRAKKILGNVDRATIGKKLTIEGQRASKDDTTPNLNRKKKRSKTGRVTKRSQAFKKSMRDTSKSK